MPFIVTSITHEESMAKAEKAAAVPVSHHGSKQFRNLSKVHIFKPALMRTLDFLILTGQMKKIKERDYF